MQLMLSIILLLFFTACNSVGTDVKQPEDEKNLADHIQGKAVELDNTDDLAPLISRAADKKLVLLGEASHGTHEYYKWRDLISRRLISEHGFNFILVEGDFASLFELNRYVKNLPGAADTARDVLERLDRWPVWMWSNHETLGLAEWLRQHNDSLPAADKVGFYGMDVYDEWRSKTALLDFLREHNEELHGQVSDDYAGFAPYVGNSWNYARDVRAGRVDFSDNTQTALDRLKNHRRKFDGISDYDYFFALQNAYVFKNAEKFYRKSALSQGAGSWNARARHMYETAVRLLDLYGPESRGIVWAHNTHIGDASFTTEMSSAQQVNIGELSRKHFGRDNVFLVGFTTYKGKVQAGFQWGSPRVEMEIPDAQKDSIEEIMHRTGLKSFYLIFDESDRNNQRFMQIMGNRAVGVVYNPRFDPRQFVRSVVPMRYDALIFFDVTAALKPLKP